jgi:hypothetical protein
MSPEVPAHPTSRWALAVVVLTAGCLGGPLPLALEIDRSLERGAAFLLARQDDDGAWRSDVYGAFKGGDALTPLVLRALDALPPTPEARRAVARGTDYLAALAPVPGAAPPSFPVYTAAQAVEALSRSADPRHRAARDAWVADLAGRQLDEDLGWSEDDPFFGGWGYSTAVPWKPAPGELSPPLVESNTSATVFALSALAAAGALLADGSVCARALVFLERVQNYSKTPSAFDDGGFFFIPDDPVRNKAGVAGAGGDGWTRYHSYGSATADGLRGLLLCGRPAEDPRVRAALAWLAATFSGAGHPGQFAPRLAADRDGLFFYWAASVTEAFALAGTGPTLTASGEPPVAWAEELARELVRRQGEDGAWANPVVTMREDEPLVATSMAILALARSRSLE